MDLVSYATVVDVKPAGVSRAAATLVALGSGEATARGGLGVVRIAELVGADKGHVSRLLTTLAEHGLVERDVDTREYRLGWQLYALAARAGDQRLLETARPLLGRLVRDLGERVSLSVLRGAEVLTVFSESPSRAVQATGWVGRTVPAYCTSSGRALLFDHGRDELATVFAGVRFRSLGPNAPPDVRELYRRIDAGRPSGFAVVDEESEPGLVAAAAPVRDFRGRVCAAVNVSGPKFRLGGRTRLLAVGRAVKVVTDELSLLLGWAQDDVASTSRGGRS